MCRFAPLPLLCAAALLASCLAAPPAAAPDGEPTRDAGAADAPPGGCPPGSPGAACLLALHDRVAATCPAEDAAALVAALEARRGEWPVWHDGRALFVTDRPAQIAGAMNDWRADADATTPLCDTGLATAIVWVPRGRWPYKLVIEGAWSLDPGNQAFAFDDFAGNRDGRNSVVNTPDSGLGHLVRPPAPLCSAALGNCRHLTAYLPRGYGDPAHAERRYPVVFLHDGQNVFDDHDCCFGHTGWEVNVTLDAEIAAGHVEEVIVVAADHAGVDRNAEYGWTHAAGGRQETFMRFQVEVVQPAAEARWRIDPRRRHVGGSSLGGLVSMRLALAYPDQYAGAASLSGAFWPGRDTGTALADTLAATGKVAVPIYLDHGGTIAGGEDGATDSIAIREQLVGLGWVRADSPACPRGAPGPEALCYHHAVGATHDELAWRDRAWRMFHFLVGR
jgi:predicted alpha/beta superfamily hydrolase